MLTEAQERAVDLIAELESRRPLPEHVCLHSTYYVHSQPHEMLLT